MEFHYSLFIVIATFILIAISIAILRRRSKKIPTLPPQPWKLPFIGNLHQLIGSHSTHQTLRDLARKHGLLMHLQLGEISTIVASSPQMAKENMKTQDLQFAAREEFVH